MRVIITAFLLLISLNVLAQQITRRVTGVLRDRDGTPLPGVNVVVKGTTHGTVTDVEGRYSIDAPIGSVLVFSFIGMQTREMVVTADSGEGGPPARREKAQQKVATRWSQFTSAGDSTRPGNGVAVISDLSGYSYSGAQFDPQSIFSIRPAATSLFRRRDNLRYVIRNATPYGGPSLEIEYRLTVGVERATARPPLQQEFAQGRGLAWQGPEQNEIFSWGPPLGNLEYNGVPTAYDSRGDLVGKGTGAGLPAQAYDRDIFRTGYTTSNHLAVTNRVMGGHLASTADYRTQDGVVPGSSMRHHQYELSLKEILLASNLRLWSNARYASGRANYLNRGANYARLAAAAWLTPPSFDNTNGLTYRSRGDNNAMYTTPDGRVRSHAPARADNPYMLIDRAADRESEDRFLHQARLEYRVPDNWTFELSNALDRQSSRIVNGLHPGTAYFPQGLAIHRNETSSSNDLLFSTSWTGYAGGWSIIATGAYKWRYERNDLERRDAIGFANETWPEAGAASMVALTMRRPARSSHQALLNTTFATGGFHLRAGNYFYFSSTARRPEYVNLFPSLRAGLDFSRMLYTGVIHELEVTGAVSRTIEEAPLIYRDWSHVATQLNAAQFRAYHESGELFGNTLTKPATAWNSEGLLRVTSNVIEGSVRVTSKAESDVAYPVWRGTSFALENAVDLRSTTSAVSLGYHADDENVAHGVTVEWSRFAAIVTSTSRPSGVAVAGFREAALVLREDERFGTLYGTRFRRDDAGRLIVDEEGYPLVDEGVHPIGNTLPDYNLTMKGYVSYQKFRLGVLLDYRHGGDVWNGTRAALDYHGASAGTARERDRVTVYPGVTASGEVNTTVVVFHDPAADISRNRWVRYGFAGVAEEYIEDGTSLRLSEVSLSWFTVRRLGPVRRVHLALVGRNIALATAYRGVDPSTSLFGQRNAGGLDLFNVPATRSFHLQITANL